jgi:hypothetical protein
VEREKIGTDNGANEVSEYMVTVLDKIVAFDYALSGKIVMR